MEVVVYTEEQARNKECSNSIKDYPNNKRCTAQRCMAWRWAEVRDPTYPEYSEGLTMRYVKSDVIGYCGLAGKP